MAGDNETLEQVNRVGEDARIPILIVEDMEITRIGLRLRLEQDPAFIVVGEAADGVSAVKQARELSPAVVLMDIGLPVLDGIEAAREIKTELPHVKLVMFTSHESDDSVFAALSAGADGYCLKSISKENLSMAVKAVAGGAAWLDPGIAGKVLRSCVLANQADEGRAAAKYALSARELEVLELVVQGVTNQEIANRLVLSLDTVKTHMSHILKKLSVSDRTQAAVKAMREKIV